MSLKLKKILRRQLRTGFDKLPDFIQGPIYRNMLCLTDKIPSELTFKIAENDKELEQAFELVYQSYKDIGIIDDSEDQIWMTKYHLMPSSSVLIVKWKEEVIGTACVILDSPLNLPIDQVADLSSYRNNGQAIAEISSLAIRKEYRGKRSSVIMPLLKFIYEYSYHHAEVDILIATIHKSARGYFRHILGFQDLPRNTDVKYSMVKDARPSTLVIDLNALLENYKNVYSKEKNDKNLYRYYKDIRFENFNFGKSPINGMITPVLRPEYLDYFLSKKKNIFNLMLEEETRVIGSSYFYNEFKNILSKYVSSPVSYETRGELRVLFNKKLKVKDNKNNKSLNCKLRDISRKGISLRCIDEIIPGTILSVSIPINDSNLKFVEADFRVLWGRNNIYGCEVIHSQSNVWPDFIDILEGEFTRLAS